MLRANHDVVAGAVPGEDPGGGGDVDLLRRAVRQEPLEIQGHALAGDDVEYRPLDHATIARVLDHLDRQRDEGGISADRATDVAPGDDCELMRRDRTAAGVHVTRETADDRLPDRVVDPVDLYERGVQTGVRDADKGRLGGGVGDMEVEDRSGSGGRIEDDLGFRRQGGHVDGQDLEIPGGGVVDGDAGDDARAECEGRHEAVVLRHLLAEEVSRGGSRRQHGHLIDVPSRRDRETLIFGDVPAPVDRQRSGQLRAAAEDVDVGRPVDRPIVGRRILGDRAAWASSYDWTFSVRELTGLPLVSWPTASSGPEADRTPAATVAPGPTRRAHPCCPARCYGRSGPG